MLCLLVHTRHLVPGWQISNTNHSSYFAVDYCTACNPAEAFRSGAGELLHRYTARRPGLVWQGIQHVLSTPPPPPRRYATRHRPHGASRLVRAMSAWLVKTRRAPSRHIRDARVYGHTTTAMHKLSTLPLPRRYSSTLPSSLCLYHL